MIDKKISLGTVVTILTILATCIYTQGIMSNKVNSFEIDTNTHSVKIDKNIESIQELEISVAKIESKIDEGFKRLETLIIEN